MTGRCATTGLDADVCFGGCCVPATAEEVAQLVADGHVDPAVADEFAAQVARDLEELW